MSDLTKRKARKDHRCSFCGQVIARRTVYFEIQLTPWSHPDNECFYTWRAHPDCWRYWLGYGADCDYLWDDHDTIEQEQFKRALDARHSPEGVTP